MIARYTDGTGSGYTESAIGRVCADDFTDTAKMSASVATDFHFSSRVLWFRGTNVRNARAERRAGPRFRVS